MTWGELIRQIESEYGAAEDMHVIPVDDLKEHLEKDCWCIPAVEYEGDVPIYIHNSLDGRERTHH